MLIEPDVFRDWVQLGTPLTPNDQNNGEAAFPEFHAAYAPHWAWNMFKKTGSWPDGTVLCKELTLVGSRKAPSGTGYFEGEFHGLDVAVKDAKMNPKTPGNWAYYNFNHSKPPYAREAAAQPKANCSSCHEATAGAEADYTFIKYYPKALEAKAKSLFKNNLAVCIICVFCFQGWRNGHGRQGAQANPSVSLSRMSVTQRYRIGGVPPSHQSCDCGTG